MTPLAFIALGLLVVAAGFASTLTIMALRAKSQQRKVRAMYGIKGAKVSFAQYVRAYAHRHGLAAGFLMACGSVLGIPAVGGFWKAANTANKVHVGPSPDVWYKVPLTVKTATNLRSGRVVKKDTNDDEIQILGAGEKNGLAVVGAFNLTNPAWDHTTAPAIGDVLECYILAPGEAYKFRNGANLAQGDQAQWGATGLAALASAAAGDTAKRICRVTESVDGSMAEANVTGVVC